MCRNLMWTTCMGNKLRGINCSEVNVSSVGLRQRLWKRRLSVRQLFLTEGPVNRVVNRQASQEQGDLWSNSQWWSDARKGLCEQTKRDPSMVRRPSRWSGESVQLAAKQLPVWLKFTWIDAETACNTSHFNCVGWIELSDFQLIDDCEPSVWYSVGKLCDRRP